MSGITLLKENGKTVVYCSECGGIMEKATVDFTKLFETGKLKKVSTVCKHCKAKAKFSLQFTGVEYGK